MRSLLIVDMNDERELAAALGSEADALLLDLAGRSGSDRIEARGLVTEALKRRRRRLFVRVDRLDGPDVEADLDAIMPGGPDGILSPGAIGGADVQRLGAKLAVREAAFGLKDGATRVLAVATESPRAALALSSYVGCSARLDALIFESDRLAVSLRSRQGRRHEGAEMAPLRHAREALLLAAAAAGVAAIDAISPGERGDAAFRADVSAAWRDGFSAKLAASPFQAAAINAFFSEPAAD